MNVILTLGIDMRYVFILIKYIVGIYSTTILGKLSFSVPSLTIIYLRKVYGHVINNFKLPLVKGLVHFSPIGIKIRIVTSASAFLAKVEAETEATGFTSALADSNL